MTASLLRSAASLLPLLADRRRAARAGDADDARRHRQLRAVLPEADFIRREAMVPMRDGIKLYTVIVMKKGTTNGPILLSRTPYDAQGHHRTASRASAIVDILPSHGRGVRRRRLHPRLPGHPRPARSEGAVRPEPPDRRAAQQRPGSTRSTDAYDTIDWLVKNMPESNGKVGVIGSSYLGFTTLMAEINPHPALKAAVPQSPMVDGWMGDDWFHNGAFRVSALDYRGRA